MSDATDPWAVIHHEDHNEPTAQPPRQTVDASIPMRGTQVDASIPMGGSPGGAPQSQLNPAAVKAYIDHLGAGGVQRGLIDPATGQLTQAGYADLLGMLGGGGQGMGAQQGGGSDPRSPNDRPMEGYVGPTGNNNRSGVASAIFGDGHGGTTYVGSFSSDPAGAPVYRRNDGSQYYIENRETGVRRSVNPDGTDYQPNWQPTPTGKS